LRETTIWTPVGFLWRTVGHCNSRATHIRFIQGPVVSILVFRTVS
jgi:hypothetical protein